jgi:predicted lipoprotein with Yx(FWY)xxD motif
MRTTRRADGRLQLVYNGHPLYALTADTRPDQIGGQGFLGTWHAVSPAGHQVGGRRGSPPASY